MSATSEQHVSASSASSASACPRNTPPQTSRKRAASWTQERGVGVGGVVGAGVGAGGSSIWVGGVSGASAHLVRLTIPETHATFSPRAHAGTGVCRARSGAIHLSQHSLCLYLYAPPSGPSPHPSGEAQYTNALHVSSASHAAQHASAEDSSKFVPSATGSPL